MDDLRDKAAGTIDAERAADLDGEYTIESPALYPADDVTAPGEYPEYGDWLALADGEGFVECPRGLAVVLVQELPENYAGPFTLTVHDVQKDAESGEFRFDATVDADS